MQFHVSHMVPDPRMHGLYGYREVIETLAWGLAQLGHDVSVGANYLELKRINIVLGAHILPETEVAKFPDDTICYNLEQIGDLPLDKYRPSFHLMARRFQIWDYNQSNMQLWQRFNPRHQPVLLPIGWAPILERIAPRDQDIDVLFYGVPTKIRMQVFEKICQWGIKSVFVCGLYGSSRDDLIARSKIVLNLNQITFGRIFEVVRVSYLLANGKAVVSDVYPESYIEPDLREAVAFVPLDGMVATCQKLLVDESARRALESRGKAIIQRRDIRTFLKPVLDGIAPTTEGK